MVKVPAPGYLTEGSCCAARKDFFISADLTGKEFNGTNTMKFVGLLEDIFIPVPIQRWFKYFWTKTSWLYPCFLEVLYITLSILQEVVMAFSA